MTPNERIFIRSCISNGFEFKRGQGGVVTVGGAEMTLERFEELILEVEDALDNLEEGKRYV